MNLTLPEVGLLMDITGGFYVAENVLYHRDTGKVRYAPIPENRTQPKIIPRGSILHTNAGPQKTSWWSLWKFWNREDIRIEPHLQIDMDGSVTQPMDFNVKADCNYKGSGWTFEGKLYGFISFETQDNGYPTLDTTPWPEAQLESIIGILTWLTILFDTECTVCTHWQDSGIDYHSKFAEWSVYVGKTCPGKARIQQMDYVRMRVAGQVMKFLETR